MLSVSLARQMHGLAIYINTLLDHKFIRYNVETTRIRQFTCKIIEKCKKQKLENLTIALNLSAQQTACHL